MLTDDENDALDRELCFGKEIGQRDPAKRLGDMMQIFDLGKNAPVIHLLISSFTPTKTSAII
jgi:hypothetical protein